MPEILRSGDHGRIARWRRDQALLRTAARRPDLLAALPAEQLDKRDVAALRGGRISGPGRRMWQSREVAVSPAPRATDEDPRFLRGSESPNPRADARCAVSLTRMQR